MKVILSDRQVEFIEKVIDKYILDEIVGDESIMIEEIFKRFKRAPRRITAKNFKF